MVTMRDVADVVGVSVMTVSNAFNRPDQLSAELRERILRRAHKMGYHGPSATGRALRHGRTNAFGVVFSEPIHRALADPFTTEWLAGFSEVMAPTRSSVVLMSVPGDDVAGVAALHDTPIDGVAGACAVHPIMDAARRRGIPVVAGDAVGDSYVSIDDRAAALEVGAHLRALGHRRVWVLHGPPLGAAPAAGAALLEGVDVAGWPRLAGLLAGLDGCDVRHLQAAGWGRADARRAASLLVGADQPPTAVAGLSDHLALGLIDALRDLGLELGRDVAVTGFDDVEEAAAARLTTVRQPIREKGARSAALLLDPSSQPRQITLPHHLLVRESTTGRQAGRPSPKESS